MPSAATPHDQVSCVLRQVPGVGTLQNLRSRFLFHVPDVRGYRGARSTNKARDGATATANMAARRAPASCVVMHSGVGQEAGG